MILLKSLCNLNINALKYLFIKLIILKRGNMTSNISNDSGVVFLEGINQTIPIAKVLSPESKIMTDLWGKVKNMNIKISSVESCYLPKSELLRDAVKNARLDYAEVKQKCDIIRSVGAVALDIEIELASLNTMIHKLALKC